MKTLLVPLQNIPMMTATLAVAVGLARRSGAYIEGFPLRFGIPQYAAAELATGILLDTYQVKSEAELNDMRNFFEAFMLKHDVPRATAGSNPPCFGWLETAPEGEDFVGSYGRAFDLIVMARSDIDAVGPHRRAIESALFESGRPVLLAPSNGPRSVATNIMIHWNGSTEQARANAFAMPLLRLAERVSILTVVGGQAVPGPSAGQIARQLQYNGIAASLISVELDGRETGEAVLDAARAHGCDLLIKGAFTRTRLRQMIFGGATSYIMEHADISVLMAH
ncbi:universal stress protein [Bradyrhizobium yuanmingense]|uniref:universal stress protein n=1 Tax=Bradyrhizobium TaxID=374 RepID=UPI000560D3BB|nr:MULTISPECIES: universal stress protein [Bradyrhizobium]MCA1383617.1 universal stress protein [Bradyrhizobium sp. BRP05]MCA1420472.1 universal stress protein [Bradyrhizobium sp. BRP23]MCA1435809.1 universal stress protein [Bradyrhizobium sp. BRP20]UWU85573.1 universal stress protein [Bradyrhizobium sp. CB1024]